MKLLSSLLAAGALITLALPAAAQDEPRVISGTITNVNGHLVTIQRAQGTIVVDDQPALDQRMTGNVATGRRVVARGHWQNGTFYATSFADADVYAEAGESGENDTDASRLHGAVRGTITAISGHLVTVKSGDDTFVINDQPALDRRLTGSVTMGRDVIASGYWQGGTFYATTVSDASAAASSDTPDFGAFRHVPDSLSGTITAVSGNQVTLQQATRSLTVNDQPALNAKATGPVAVGRQVVADGYWLHGVFYATTFADATP
ncbi:MAG TPA: DUF5666 domain-containing protein [Candidatus Baltobacteraceae bacterium]|jgi:hypothetical protein|nr:DUF5666 domain-containing protein [Candidatus Baltobacteraceae bacterium]